MQTKGGYAGAYGQQGSFDSVDSFSQLIGLSANNEPPESMPVKLGMIYYNTYSFMFMTNVIIVQWRVV